LRVYQMKSLDKPLFTTSIVRDLIKCHDALVEKHCFLHNNEQTIFISFRALFPKYVCCNPEILQSEYKSFRREFYYNLKSCNQILEPAKYILYVLNVNFVPNFLQLN
jgi:hypothetical protein